MNATTYPHIEVRNGTPFIAGSQFKIVHLILARMAHNWDGDELHQQYPTLSPAEIYSALAFYHDNQADMDEMIEEQLRDEENFLAKQAMTPVRAKLLAAKYGRAPQ
jgi:uncharacterized protein (DUF433 family)